MEQVDLIKAVLEMEERKDSCEIGTAGKGGALKVYFNAGEPEQAMKRIDRALSIRAYLSGRQEQWEAMIAAGEKK
jgi:hypothetical protein